MWFDYCTVGKKTGGGGRGPRSSERASVSFSHDLRNRSFSVRYLSVQTDVRAQGQEKKATREGRRRKVSRPGGQKDQEYFMAFVNACMRTNINHREG